MAKPNLKTQPRFSERLRTTLVDRTMKKEKEGGKPAMDWMPTIDNLLESLGFVAGQRVCVSANYMNSTITITPCYE